MSDTVSWIIPSGTTLVAQTINQYYNGSPYFDLQSLGTSQTSVDLDADGTNYQPGGKVHWEVIGTVEDSPGAKRLITIATGDAIIGGELDPPTDLQVSVQSCAPSNCSLQVDLNLPDVDPDPSGSYTLNWVGGNLDWETTFMKGTTDPQTNYFLNVFCSDGTYTVNFGIVGFGPSDFASMPLNGSSGPFSLKLGSN